MSDDDGDERTTRVGQTTSIEFLIGETEGTALRVRGRRFIPDEPLTEVVLLRRDGSGVHCGVVSCGTRMFVVVDEDEDMVREVTENVQETRETISEVLDGGGSSWGVGGGPRGRPH